MFFVDNSRKTVDNPPLGGDNIPVSGDKIPVSGDNIPRSGDKTSQNGGETGSILVDNSERMGITCGKKQANGTVAVDKRFSLTILCEPPMILNGSL